MSRAAACSHASQVWQLTTKLPKGQFICLGLFYTAELVQKFADIGTFDLKDLLAYTAGTALAIGVERLSFTKNRTLDDIVVKPIVEPNPSQ